MPIVKQPFGHLPDGTPVSIFTMTNTTGMVVQVIEYGATVVSIQVPDETGQLEEVTLGFPTLEGYLQKEQPLFGATVGRYANRIANGQFLLDGRLYQLATNNGGNHLHGGVRGFDKKMWRAELFEKDHECGVILACLSPDGEEGFPGNLDCKVTLALNDKNALIIDYEAVTDKKTVLNLTNHCYFNLENSGRSDCLNHEVRICADYFTPVDKNMIPSGVLQPVKGTPFNFNRKTRLSGRINRPHPQLKRCNGFDHNFVLRKKPNHLALAAEVVVAEKQRKLEVWTTEPGVQLYIANWLDGTFRGHGGVAYQKNAALCLETQHFPDSPNQPHFPSTVLSPCELFKSRTIYQFQFTKY